MRLMQIGQWIGRLAFLILGGLTLSRAIETNIVLRSTLVPDQPSFIASFDLSSVVPTPGTLVIPDYSLYTSQDLKKWELVQSWKTNTVFRRINYFVTLTSSPKIGFFKVQR